MMMFEMHSPRRAKVLGMAVLSAAFLVGGLVGAAVNRVASAGEPERAQVGERQRGNGDGLFERLDLTPEQRAQIDSILERRRVQMDAFWEEHRPLLRAITDSTRVDIREVLTPEQRAEEERYMAERREYHKKREGRGKEWRKKD